MTKTALITGATSGIGKSVALLLDKNGYNIIACGRRKERLDELSKILKNPCTTLCFDVTDKNAVSKALENLPEINVLVNNAGNAHGLSSIQDGNTDDWDAMIDINVKGLLYVTKSCIPHMKEDSIIVNIGSIAGKEVYPNGNVYCASKFAVDGLTKAMRMDLLSKNIQVSAIHPGHVETEFALVRFKGDADRAKQTYKGFEPLNPDDIADAVLYVISRPKNVNIGELAIFPKAQASTMLIDRKTE